MIGEANRHPAIRPVAEMIDGIARTAWKEPPKIRRFHAAIGDARQERLIGPSVESDMGQGGKQKPVTALLTIG
jgi:hypothetical protein